MSRWERKADTNCAVNRYGLYPYSYRYRYQRVWVWVAPNYPYLYPCGFLPVPVGVLPMGFTN